MTRKALWRCPACSREFVKPRQWHSCNPVSVDSHFEGKEDGLRGLFDELCKRLREFGPLRVDAVRSGINLIPKHHMGGVRVLKDRLHVGFLLNRRIDHPRISRGPRVGPSAFIYAVNVAKKDEFDPELLSWLKEAYKRAARI